MKTTINPKVLDVIDKIIETTKKLNGGNLIDITHVIGGPWDKVYQEGANNEIDDQTILKYNYKVMNCLTESWERLDLNWSDFKLMDEWDEHDFVFVSLFGLKLTSWS